MTSPRCKWLRQYNKQSLVPCVKLLQEKCSGKRRHFGASLSPGEGFAGSRRVSNTSALVRIHRPLTLVSASKSDPHLPHHPRHIHARIESAFGASFSTSRADLLRKLCCAPRFAACKCRVRLRNALFVRSFATVPHPTFAHSLSAISKKAHGLCLTPSPSPLSNL